MWAASERGRRSTGEHKRECEGGAMNPVRCAAGGRRWWRQRERGVLLVHVELQGADCLVEQAAARGEMGSVLRKNQHSMRTHCTMSSRDLKLRFNLVFRLKSIRLRPCQLTAVHSTPPAPSPSSPMHSVTAAPSSRRSLSRHRFPSSATLFRCTPCPVRRRWPSPSASNHRRRQHCLSYMRPVLAPASIPAPENTVYIACEHSSTMNISVLPSMCLMTAPPPH